ncbi:flagellar hook-length control protein FliK [Marinobacter sp.]|uniref:flagellar hook-length control protein FliK n=1 Tax=Marinobacter sp. TaxID=50741 RepID=UPI003561DB20
MSSMVLTQLLNPDSGVDRKNTGKAQDSQSAADKGPSRYDEIMRQQEKRLEQRRADDRARERTMAQERQTESRRADVAEKGNDGRSARAGDADDRKDAGKTARQDRPETPDDSKPAARRKETSGGDHAADAGQKTEAESQVARSSVDDQALEGLPLDGQVAGLLELVDEAEVPVATGVNGLVPNGATGSLKGAPAAGLLAPGLSLGQQPGGASTVGKLFAAIMQGGKESAPRGGDLLAGLQNVSESSGKLADTLMTRMSAPELTQSLNQAATLRGQEAQALMRSYSTSVDAPVGESEWGEKVMGKLAWLTASQMSVAEIHITPPELGPLDVRVQVQNDQATVTVHATTPAVREQLELHGHRLRDMLSEQGLSLEGFDVSDSSGRETADQQGDGEGHREPGTGPRAGELDGAEADNLAAGSLDLSWRGEVDLYA